MNITIVIQHATHHNNIPTDEQFKQWIGKALAQPSLLPKPVKVGGEMTVRIVDEAESKGLNQRYRDQNKATNVLAFSYHSDDCFGDLAICASIVEREAQQQGKALNSHWAHLIIHGTLHLLGYDHISIEDADKMENVEISLLQQFGFPNPYREANETHD